MDTQQIDYTLETLLSMVGVFASPDGWWVKTEARRVLHSIERPFGLKYSITLHRAISKNFHTTLLVFLSVFGVVEART